VGELRSAPSFLHACLPAGSWQRMRAFGPGLYAEYILAIRSTKIDTLEIDTLKTDAPINKQ
jgi:hypothetical protein